MMHLGRPVCFFFTRAGETCRLPLFFVHLLAFFGKVNDENVAAVALSC